MAAGDAGWGEPSDEEARAGLDEGAAELVTGAALSSIREAVLASEFGSAWKAGRTELDKVSFLRRWLIARDGDAEKAAEMLSRHAQWRVEECPWYPSLPPRETIEEDLAAGKFMVHGHDMSDRPCLYVMAGRHDSYATTPERTQLAVLYGIEQMMRVLDDGLFATVVFDFLDAGWSSMDTEAAKFVVMMLSLNYPEAVAKIYIVNHGIAFSALWAIISPFLSARTTEKIIFLGEGEILEKIDADQLPTRFGGTAAVRPDACGMSEPDVSSP